MHVVDEGEGPPVVMVHGNPAWSFLYRHLVQRLRPSHRCVAMDHLGFGLSDKPRGWSYLPEAHAENLEALIDGLGLRDVTLVVQDSGGPIGLAYAVAHPENVARLVIMNSWAWPVDRDPYYLAFSGFMGGPIGRRLIRRRNFFARAVMRRAYGDPRRLTPAIHAHYLEALPTPEDREGSAVFPRRIVGSHPVAAAAGGGAPCAGRQAHADRLGHARHRLPPEGAAPLAVPVPRLAHGAPRRRRALRAGGGARAAGGRGGGVPGERRCAGRRRLIQRALTPAGATRMTPPR